MMQMKASAGTWILQTTTTQDALSVVANAPMRTAFVVDYNKKLLGYITHAELHHALMSGASVNDEITDWVNEDLIVSDGNEKKEIIAQRAIDLKVSQVAKIDRVGVFQGVYDCHALLKNHCYPNRIILMVGGLGERLMPLTKHTPKPMLEVGGKPLLETIIKNFVDNGFKRFTLCVNYKADVIQNYFGDGKKFNAEIDYVTEGKRMGTAGALDFLREQSDEPVFVSNGDILTKANFQNMLYYHEKQKVAATVGVRQHTMQIPYGVMQMDGLQVTDIQEKPEQQYYVNAGVYILSKEAFAHLPKDTYYDMPDLLKSIMSNSQAVNAYPIIDYWLDIGHADTLAQAKSDFSDVFGKEEK